ncbi:MAG: peptide chain release factor 1 [Spirochaetales bacterium]|nr:MAG: peptide chain release factor 1 [Spirochaetales bacterium]
MTDTSLIEKRLETIRPRYEELQKAIADPSLPKNPKAYKETMQEYGHVEEIITVYDELLDVKKELAEARTMASEESDAELREMAAAETEELQTKEEKLTGRLKVLLVPRDPLDGKDIIVEIRAGTGGDEAGLFAADLYRRSVYGSLRYESGVHRVQRVPVTESQGRIHTSAVTVAVLPEAEDTDIEINDADVKVDVYRSSGPGGQSVNTTDSAVRLTHLPSGLVVTCQDEKSQIKNKAKAFRVLRSRLYELEESKRQAERAAERKSQVGSGDRSERIRTYNFPQNRLTDHRINLTLYKLDHVMEGEIDEIIDALKVSALEEALKG